MATPMSTRLLAVDIGKDHCGGFSESEKRVTTLFGLERFEWLMPALGLRRMMRPQVLINAVHSIGRCNTIVRSLFAYNLTAAAEVPRN